jgi:GT2 family glycosyltransferase
MQKPTSLQSAFMHEPVPGLARARNTGLCRVKADIIVFTDDDCRLSAEFFHGLAQAFVDVDGPAVIGGRVLLGGPLELDFTTRLGNHLERFHDRLVPGGFILGCNLAMNRLAQERVGKFDENFGAGSVLKSAEDTDYTIRAHNAGIPVIFSPLFTVSHYHGRASRKAIADVQRNYSFGNGALYAKHFRSSRWLRRQLGWLVKGCMREAVSGRHFDEHFGFSHFPILSDTLAGMLRYWSLKNADEAP